MRNNLLCASRQDDVGADPWSSALVALVEQLPHEQVQHLSSRIGELADVIRDAAAHRNVGALGMDARTICRLSPSDIENIIAKLALTETLGLGLINEGTST